MKNVFSSWIQFITGKKTRWVTIIIWILLVAVFSAVWPQVNSQETNSNQLLPEDAMSVTAAKIVEEQFSDDAGIPLLFAWYRESGLKEADFQKVQTLYADFAADPVVKQQFAPPLDQAPLSALKGMASEDGKALNTPLFFNKDASTDELDEALAQLGNKIELQMGTGIASSDLSEDGLHVRLTGPVGIQTDAVSLFSRADVTLLIATVLIVLVLLITLYRSPILAIVPLIAVGFAYGLVNPLLGVLAQKGWIEVDAQAISIMTVLLFGAGTDYCLFMISRYRDELREEESKYAALQRSIKETGGAIMVSALTTVTALLTLALAYYASYDRFAIPFSLSILIMGIAALTLLPAILSLLGRAAFIPFIPRTEEMIKQLEKKKGRRLRRSKSTGPAGRAFGRWSTEKPWLIILICLVALGGLASFTTKAEYTYGLLDSFPKDMPSREGISILSEHYPPGEIAPVQLIVHTDTTVDAVKARVMELDMIERVRDPIKGSNDASYQIMDITLAIDPYSDAAINGIPKIKEVVEKELERAGIKGSEEKIWIGGETATLYDTEQMAKRDQSVIIPAVLTIIALLLFVYLRSLVAMVYLLATVVLSYFAALGLGWIIIHYVLGADAMQGLIPVYAFVFLVALGEDYNIFMASSIWRKREKAPLKQAIREGVSETSAVIGSAGLILAGTFSVLAVMPLQVLVHFGLVTALGILLDTFVVRPLLVPSITTVLGRYAFWPGKQWRKVD
ncbi:MMPL family transporter [Virgibacillus sp. W0430]|uniref:MMPL family transporter n=1 Tax=Virgibacillus sp. W0430 TaxID=3391580 RepID=UPI003F47CF6E